MEGYPERGELVLVEVERVTDHGAFVRLEEYGQKQGIVSLREFSQKWVKNPRDYLREGQKAVLKVLRINPERGHIDLSLKEVNENERRNKLKDYKLEMRVSKLMDHFAKQTGKKADELYKLFGDKLVEDYGSLYEAFAQVSNDKEDLKKYIKDEKLRVDILKAVHEGIHPTLVSVRGFVMLSAEASDGVDLIKEALKVGMKAFPPGVQGAITYVSAPNYRIDVTAGDYKTAEKAMRSSYEAISKYAGSKGIEFEFKKKLDAKAS